MKRRIIVILGPTASGKTGLGIALAKKNHGIILSADSRQIYRGMDIGTAKVTRREMRGVPHYLLDLASPKTSFTVAQFQRHANRILSRTPDTTPVFVVGGSPFYIEAITNPSPYPEVKPNVKLRKRLSKKTTTQLFAILKNRDPRRARSIDAHNPRRLIRALEIVDALGKVPERNTAAPYRILKVGIDVPRAKLYRNIDRRVDARMPGMLNETKRLHAQGISWKRLERFGLEYRWMSRVLTKKTTRREGLERLKGNIHAFARRQLTWWRNDGTIEWITNRRSAERLVDRFLK